MFRRVLLSGVIAVSVAAVTIVGVMLLASRQRVAVPLGQVAMAEESCGQRKNCNPEGTVETGLKVVHRIRQYGGGGYDRIEPQAPTSFTLLADYRTPAGTPGCPCDEAIAELKFSVAYSETIGTWIASQCASRDFNDPPDQYVVNSTCADNMFAAPFQYIRLIDAYECQESQQPYYYNSSDHYIVVGMDQSTEVECELTADEDTDTYYPKLMTFFTNFIGLDAHKFTTTPVCNENTGSSYDPTRGIKLVQHGTLECPNSPTVVANYPPLYITYR